VSSARITHNRSTIAEDLEAIAECIPHMVWITAADGVTEYLNREALAFTGIRDDGARGRGWISVLRPDDVARTRFAWSKATRSHAPYEIEYRVRRADGVYRWMAVRGKPMYDEHGTLVLWIGTWTDIDDHRLTEDDLRRAQRSSTEALTFLETIQSKAPIAFHFVDRDLRLLRINDTPAQMIGSPPEALLGRLVRDAVPWLWGELEPIYRQVLATGEPNLNVAVVRETPDYSGELRHWVASYYPVRIAGEVIGVGAVGVDVTEAKRSEIVRATIMDTMAEGLCALDKEGRVTFLNAPASTMLGWTEDELRGRPLHELAHHRRLVHPQGRHGLSRGVLRVAAARRHQGRRSGRRLSGHHGGARRKGSHSPRDRRAHLGGSPTRSN
jgi:two-component system NtrC family sensor kinase